MSLYGAMSTAVSGLGAQARALGAISDNVANSQTVGFKRVDTAFVNYVTAASHRVHTPGTVVARPEATNTLQGTLQQVEYDTGIAISGQGFFPVRRPILQASGETGFTGTQFYTRAGDFRPDREGYLTNSAGYVLEAWSATQDPQTGVVSIDRGRFAPVRLQPTLSEPVASSTASIAANVPASPATAGESFPFSFEIFDALGNPRRVEATLTQDTATANRWFLDLDMPGAAADPVDATDRIVIDFGTGATAGMPIALSYEQSGTTAPTVSTATLPAAQGAGVDPAYLDVSLDYGLGAQPVRLNLGTFGRSDGLTQFASAGFDMRAIERNGAPPGSLTGASITESGDVVAAYDNGLTRVLARVPVVTFANADGLSREDGQAFTLTAESGQPLIREAAAEGAGQIVGGAIERSNVDIASEFTKLIVAQRAYSANTRIITAADEMLSETIAMRR